MACFEALSQVQEKNLVSFGASGALSLTKLHFCSSLFIQKAPFQDTPDSSSVRRDLAWEPEGRRFESGDRLRGFRCELLHISWKPFDVSIMPLIAPLAWAPQCCFQLYLGVKQRSCETPIVFVRFPIIITILPLESMAAHRTPGSKVMKFGT